MMSWNGLLRKEWVLMRYSLVTFIVVFVVIAVSSFCANGSWRYYERRRADSNVFDDAYIYGSVFFPPESSYRYERT